MQWMDKFVQTMTGHSGGGLVEDESIVPFDEHLLGQNALRLQGLSFFARVALKQVFQALTLV